MWEMFQFEIVDHVKIRSKLKDKKKYIFQYNLL